MEPGAALIVTRSRLRKKPYRGIYKAIADEFGVSKVVVMKSIWSHGKPKYLQALKEKIRAIEHAELAARTTSLSNDELLLDDDNTIGLIRKEVA